MKKILLIFSFFIFHFSLITCVKAQNLVPNASFENLSSCPTDQGQIDRAIPWYSPTYYGSLPMSDVFNSCVPPPPFGMSGIPLNGWGYQYPRTGKGYAGACVFANYMAGSEYISIKLDSVLETGKNYCINYYVSLSNYDTTIQPNGGSTYAIDCMGLYISDTTIHLYTYSTIPVVPQIINPAGVFLSDTVNWMLVSGVYSANGGEQYITIGNFKDSASTNYIQISYSHSNLTYYYIDDVSVYPCDAPVYAAEAGNNVVICKGDSVQIGSAPHAQYIYSWQAVAGISNDSIADPFVKPAVTTTYYLTQKDFKFEETFDSVTVIVEDCNDSITVPNAFTPNGDGINDYFTVKGDNIKTISGKIFNRWGQELYKFTDANSKWDGKYNNKEVSEGVYFYSIEVVFENGEVQLKHGSIQLIR
jgi:gliding motility-associated-like protein